VRESAVPSATLDPRTPSHADVLAFRYDRGRSFALAKTNRCAAGDAYCDQSGDRYNQKLFHLILPKLKLKELPSISRQSCVVHLSHMGIAKPGLR
jgi:hypothetical protein